MGSRVEKVLDVLRSSPSPLTIPQIATLTGLYTQQVGVALRSLRRSGLVTQSGRSWTADT